MPDKIMRRLWNSPWTYLVCFFILWWCVLEAHGWGWKAFYAVGALCSMFVFNDLGNRRWRDH